PIALDLYKYTARPQGSGYLVNSHVVYRQENQLGAVLTKFAYSFTPNSDHIATMTTTLPTISGAQNGSGATVTIGDQFDAFGRVILHKNGDGFLTKTDYDNGTGAVTNSVLDFSYIGASNWA